MKSSKRAPRLLLDTSFLLPTLGIDVGKKVPTALKQLAELEAEAHYSRFSLLESLWVAGRMIRARSFDTDRYTLGLNSIFRGGRYQKVEEDSEVFNSALNLYSLGHDDMIDNILYSSSVQQDLRLLTLDERLREFVRSNGLKDTLIFPDEFSA